MRLDEIIKHGNDEHVSQEFNVYYAHKNQKDSNGYLVFRRVAGGYPVNWKVSEVEEHARKDWARKPNYSVGGPPRWDDQNYTFVVVKVTVRMVTRTDLTEPWQEVPSE